MRSTMPFVECLLPTVIAAAAPAPGRAAPEQAARDEEPEEEEQQREQWEKPESKAPRPRPHHHHRCAAGRRSNPARLGDALRHADVVSVIPEPGKRCDDQNPADEP